MRKIIGLGLILVVVASVPAFSQVGSACTQTLRLARSTYDAGRLHELPGILKNCLSQSQRGDAGGFSKSELVEAYKLLTLSYIYLEEPEKADTVMLALLNADHFFKINTSVDPAEFVALYKKFRYWQVFRVGVKFGANATFANPTEDYYVTNGPKGSGKYSPSVGIQFGAVFERDISKHFTLAPEVFYTSRTYKYNNNQILTNDSTGKTTGSFTSKPTLSWIDFNPIVQFRLRGTDKTINQVFIPYIGIGPGFSYLLGAKGTNQSSVNGVVVTGADVDYKKSSSYKSLAYSAVAVAGVKYLIGGVYLTADVRIQYGLTNIVNPSHRSNSEATFDYAAGLNNSHINNVMVNLGVMYPFFKPKKLIK